MRPEEMTGKLIGHYRILRPLGIGGTSTVFLARDVNLQRDVALKVFQPREGETQDFLRRFAREARVVAQLDHPNILSVYDYGEEHDTAYLVMPHMPGGSLRDLLNTRKKLPATEAVRLLTPILQALQYAHDRGLIHRDIKPGNILLKVDGTPMLSDFGLVKVTSSDTSDTTAIISETTSMTNHAIAGTPDYMSPEQITSSVTPASDVYSMGVVLYETLTGTRPFSAENYMGVLMKQMYERPRHLRAIEPTISPAIEAVVLHALEKEASKRFQRPDALNQALVQALSTPLDSETSPMQTATLSAADEQTLRAAQHQLLVARQAIPTSPNAQTYPNTTTSAQNQQPDNQSLPASSPRPGPGAKLVPLTRKRSPVPLLVGFLLVALLLVGGLGAALLAPGLFGKQPIIGITPPPATKTLAVSPTRSTLTTQNVPATTTTCPEGGKARRAVQAPLILGSHQQLIYIVNEYKSDTSPLQGTLKRRDVNTNLKGIEIIKMPNLSIKDAQVSQDGQWLLFTVFFNGQAQIRMVRVDGQGLQTLYCAAIGSTIVNSEWSFDQKSVIFAEGQSPLASLSLLDITNGLMQQELVQTATQQVAYAPRTWLDATRVYLVGTSTAGQTLALLDTKKGVKQHEGDLQQVIATPQTCTGFDTSYDVKQLYTSNCTGNLKANNANGPSTIAVIPEQGGPAGKIFSSPTLAITNVRAISTTTLLFMIKNTIGDTTQNGLWEINIDGSNLLRLSADTANTQSLCPYSQFTWSNISRDSNYYALQSNRPDSSQYSMYYGTLTGGDPTLFADIGDGTQLYLVGWTQL